jgi:beta-lactamase regulating signal transducer with metallopeptidase domain
MQELLELALSNAAASAVLALVAVSVGLVSRRPALVHALWLLVLLKLVTPPLVRVPVPWPARAESPAERAEGGPAVPAPSPRPAASAPAKEEDETPEAPWEALEEGPAAPVEEADAPAAEAPAEVPELAAPTAPVLSPPPPAAEAPAGTAPLWPWLLGAGWLTGSLSWLVLVAVRVRRFRLALKLARPAPPELRERVAELARRLKLKHVPATWIVPGRIAPMVWALGGPARLLLPAELFDRLDEEAADALLVHELAHLKRRDHRVRLLEMLALGLYWWCPVVWYARRELREAEEQCCDAWVVAILPGAGRAYATALLDTLDFLSAARAAAPPLASGIGQVADLKRRLTMIMRGDTPRALTWPASLVVLGLGALLLPMLPARAQDQPKQEPLAYGRIVRTAAPGDIDKQAADLDREEKAAQKRLADIKAARARLEIQRAQKKLDVQLKLLHEKAKVAGKDGVVIHIEVRGLSGKAEDIRALARKIEAVLPPGTRVLILAERVGGQPTHIRIPVRVDPRALEKWVVRPGVGRQPGQPMLPPGASDRRIEGLEKKLDSVIKELEALRKELRGRSGAGRPPGPAGLGPVPFGPGPALPPGPGTRPIEKTP